MESRYEYRLIRQTLISSIAILILFVLLTALKFAVVLLLLVALVPGFVYGIVLLKEATSQRNSAVFGMLSCALYTGCFYLLNLGHDSEFLFRLPIASAIGAIGLFTLYHLLIDKRDQFFFSLGVACLQGVLCAIPTLLFFHLSKTSENDILYCGMYLIYPLWQLAFSLLITKTNLKLIPDDRI